MNVLTAWVKALVILAVALVSTPQALAWEQQVTSAGQPVQWVGAKTLSVSVHNASDDVFDFDPLQVVSDAFWIWEDTTCLPFGGVNFVHESGSKAAVLIVFVDGTDPVHPMNLTSDKVGETRLQVVPQTGEILGGTIYLNARDYQFRLDPGEDDKDVMFALVHEIGHLLGLDHPHEGHESTVMEDRVSDGPSPHDLTDDDYDAVCTVYADSVVPESNPEIEDIEIGCAASNGTPLPTSLTLVLLLSFALARRRGWFSAEP